MIRLMRNLVFFLNQINKILCLKLLSCNSFLYENKIFIVLKYKKFKYLLNKKLMTTQLLLVMYL